MTRDANNTCTLYLCSCCLILHANGDACDCQDIDGREHPAGLLGLLADEEVSLGLFLEQHDDTCPNKIAGDWSLTECDCERIDFSSHRCDGCGSYLAGSRDLATLWVAS